MKVGLVQQKNTADIPANIQKLQDNIRKAAAMGAELVVLQELHNGLYFCQTEKKYSIRQNRYRVLQQKHSENWQKN